MCLPRGRKPKVRHEVIVTASISGLRAHILSICSIDAYHTQSLRKSCPDLMQVMQL